MRLTLIYRIYVRLGAGQCSHAWQCLALQELQRSAASGGDVRDECLRVPLGAARGSVAAADDGDGAVLGGGHHAVHDGLGAVGEVGELKDTGGSKMGKPL